MCVMWFLVNGVAYHTVDVSSALMHIINYYDGFGLMGPNFVLQGLLRGWGYVSSS